MVAYMNGIHNNKDTEYKEYFDFIASAVIVTDSDGLINAANQSASTMFKQDFYKKRSRINFSDLIVKHETTDIESLIVKAHENTSQPIELQCINSMGGTLFASIMACCIGDNQYLFTITDISQYKINEDIAKEREKRLLDLTNNMHGAVYQFKFLPNKKPEFIYISDGVYDVFEITAEELKQDSNAIMRMYSGDERNGLKKAVLESFIEQKACELEYSITTPSGREKWIFAAAVPHRMSDGKLIWTGYSMDITEQKKAQERVKQSEQRLRVHTQSSPLAYIEWDTGIHVLDWNKAAEEIFGYTKEQAIGRHGFDLMVPPELYDDTNEVWDNLLRQSGNYQAKAKCIDKSGKTIYCEWHNTPLVNEKGKVIGITSIVHDISQRRRAEKALKLSEQRFKHVAELSSDWIWETDADGKFTYISSRYSKVIGIPAEKIVGKHLREMSVSDDPQKKKQWLKAIEDILDHKGFCDYEFQVELAERRSRWFKISGSPFFDKNGNYLGHRGTGTDNTEQRLAENALIESEEKFRHIAENTFDWFWQTGSNDCFSYVSDNFLKAVNLKSEEVIGRHIKEMLVSADNDQIKDWHKLLENIDARSQFKDFEFKLLLKGLGAKWYRVSGAPYYGSYGEYLGFRGAGVDITADRTAKLEQIKSQNRINDLLELVQSVVWETDENLNINFLSNDTEQNIGIDSSLLLGKNIKELFIGGDGFVSVEQEIESRRSFVGCTIDKAQIVTLGEGSEWVEVSGKPYYDSSHGFLGYRGICKRISE